jgi:hypothetical protein
MWNKSKVCAKKRLTLADTCTSKKCERKPIKGCCKAAADCDDGDVCTTE